MKSYAIATLALIALGQPSLRAQIVISGNENKIDMTSGASKPVQNAPPDSISIVDFAQSPPKTTTLMDVPNSVLGPPCNIAISPDGKLALIANSIKLDSAAAAGWTPESYAHILDLAANPPKIIGRVQTQLQPSGLSFTPDGLSALVANRASGTVSVLKIDGAKTTQTQVIKVCEPADGVADVAVSPDGKLALASIQKGNCLAELKLADGKWAATGRQFSVYGKPYHCIITPDGELALTAGGGTGNGLDMDAISVIDLKAAPQPRTTSYIPIGTIPESFDVSPDGKLAAAVVMNGSSFGPENPLQTKAGALVILERRGRTFAVVQQLPTGRIPEGVAFTGDGKRIIVQCHPDRVLQVFDVGADGHVKDSGVKIPMPGMPSSIRAARSGN